MLMPIGGSLIGPLAAFSLKAELLTKAFRFTASLLNAQKRQKKQKSNKQYQNEVPSVSELEGNKKTAAKMQWEFKHVKRILKHGYLLTSFGCNRRTRFKQMLAKSETNIAREMDLIKFLKR